jgi:hypothetical protein
MMETRLVTKRRRSRRQHRRLGQDSERRRLDDRVDPDTCR